jgi:hypothetical protein
MAMHRANEFASTPGFPPHQRRNGPQRCDECNDLGRVATPLKHYRNFLYVYGQKKKAGCNGCSVLFDAVYGFAQRWRDRYTDLQIILAWSSVFENSSSSPLHIGIEAAREDGLAHHEFSIEVYVYAGECISLDYPGANIATIFRFHHLL